MSAGCALLINPEQREHAASGHPERPARVDAILDAVAGSGDLAITPEAAPPAPEPLMREVHDSVYLSILDQAAAAGGGYLDRDTYVTGGSMRAARTASGAVVEGVRRVLAGEARHAFAIVRPPGHHAQRALAMGFCLLNNIAVGVAAARAQGVRRLAVIDFDVHHGNGTQNTFYDDPDLLYCSTHQYGLWQGAIFFPGTGTAAERGAAAAEGTTLNIPLVPGTGDRAFLSAYEQQVGSAVEAFKPELLLVSAGFDAHANDPLAGLAVSTDGFARLAGLIRGWADRFCQGRSVWTLEGGYALDDLGDSVVACLRSLQAKGR